MPEATQAALQTLQTKAAEYVATIILGSALSKLSAQEADRVLAPFLRAAAQGRAPPGAVFDPAEMATGDEGVAAFNAEVSRMLLAAAERGRSLRL